MLLRIVDMLSRERVSKIGFTRARSTIAGKSTHRSLSMDFETTSKWILDIKARIKAKILIELNGLYGTQVRIKLRIKEAYLRHLGW